MTMRRDGKISKTEISAPIPSQDLLQSSIVVNADPIHNASSLGGNAGAQTTLPRTTLGRRNASTPRPGSPYHYHHIPPPTNTTAAEAAAAAAALNASDLSPAGPKFFDASASVIGSPYDPRLVLKDREPPKLSMRGYQTFLQAVGSYRRQILALAHASEAFVRALEDLAEYVPGAKLRDPTMAEELNMLIDSTHLIANAHQVWAENVEREFEEPLVIHMTKMLNDVKLGQLEYKAKLDELGDRLHKEEEIAFKMGKKKARDVDAVKNSLDTKYRLAEEIKRVTLESNGLQDHLAAESVKRILEACSGGVRAELETYETIVEGLKKIGAFSHEIPDVQIATPTKGQTPTHGALPPAATITHSNGAPSAKSTTKIPRANKHLPSPPKGPPPTPPPQTYPAFPPVTAAPRQNVTPPPAAAASTNVTTSKRYALPPSKEMNATITATTANNSNNNTAAAPPAPPRTSSRETSPKTSKGDLKQSDDTNDNGRSLTPPLDPDLVRASFRLSQTSYFDGVLGDAEDILPIDSISNVMVPLPPTPASVSRANGIGMRR